MTRGSRAPVERMPVSTCTRWLAAAVTVVVAGCSAPPTAPAMPPPPPPVPAPAPVAAPVDGLAENFAEMSANIRAQVGVAVVAGALSAQPARAFGTWAQGPAWSTIKVPLSIAALRKAPDQVRGLVNSAIINSDNQAAEQLWEILGEAGPAAEAVEGVLREGSDVTTAVQAQRVRVGYSAFGQTDWPMTGQARFAARLPCIADAVPVLEDMRTLDGEQQWGLANRDGVAAKGGWGPGPDGAYLVRQLAVLTGPGGVTGVALAAQSDDGSYDSAVAAINQLADWVRQHRAELPVAPC